MSRTVSFSMSDGEYSLISLDAKAKGLTVSMYCKQAAFAYVNRHASKGLMAEYHRSITDGDKIDPASTADGSRDNSQGG